MSNVVIAGIRRIALCFVCVALASCAHGGKPKASALQDITTISVAPDVVMPDSVSYLSAGQLWGAAVGGAIGGAIAAASSPQETIRSKLEEDHIDAGAILVTEMRDALAKDGRFKVVDGNADAVASFEIKEYGFKIASPMTNRMKVLMRVVMTVTARDGTSLYHRKGGGHNSEATEYSMNELLATPSKMDAAFHEAAAVTARAQVRGMVGRPAAAEPTGETDPAETQPAAPSSGVQ